MEMTDEQKNEIASIFTYQDKADLTSAEKDLLVSVFDTPEKLVILRKAFHFFTQEELGLQSARPNPGDVSANWELYGRLSYMSDEIQQRIQIAMLRLYKTVMLEKRNIKTKELDTINREKFDREELERIEKEKTETEKKQVGDNL